MVNALTNYFQPSLQLDSLVILESISTPTKHGQYHSYAVGEFREHLGNPFYGRSAT